MYRLPDRIVFTADEEYQTDIAMTLVRHFHRIWIGVSAANTGFYLGPYWSYFTWFWLLLSKGDPIILNYISALIGVVTSVFIYLIGAKLFGKRVGFIAAFLYSTLPLMVYFDQKYWNPSSVPLLNLLLVFSVYASKKNSYWLILFAIASGLVFHVHLSLVPSIIVGGGFLLFQKVYKNRKAVILSVIAFLLTMLPLIMFDYYHNYSNLKTIFRYKEISSSETTKINPSFKLKTLLDFFGRIWYLKPGSSNADEILFACSSSSVYKSSNLVDKYSTRTKASPLIIFFSSIIILAFFLNKKTWTNHASLLIASFYIVDMVSFLFFPGNSFEYYLLGLGPLYLLIVGQTINSIKIPYLYTGAIIIIGIFGLIGLFTIIKNNNEFGLIGRRQLVSKVMTKLNGQSYDLTEAGLCHKFEGWRYLFATYGKKPNKSSSDASFGWLYPSEISKQASKYSVIVNENRIPIDFNAFGANQITVGGFTAYIFQN